MHPEREKWNRKFAAGEHDSSANVQLIMYRDRLTRGRALDIGCGLGENAAILALAGWDVAACDLSDVAVRGARQRAAELKARVRIVQCDAVRLPFRRDTFNTVVCTFYLDRAVARTLPDLLRPGGTLFFQTYTREHLKYRPDFPPAYALESGELRHLFKGLEEVLYQEQDDGRRAYALLIARRPGN